MCYVIRGRFECLVQNSSMFILGSLNSFSVLKRSTYLETYKPQPHLLDQNYVRICFCYVQNFSVNMCKFRGRSRHILCIQTFQVPTTLGCTVDSLNLGWQYFGPKIVNFRLEISYERIFSLETGQQPTNRLLQKFANILIFFVKFKLKS